MGASTWLSLLSSLGWVWHPFPVCNTTVYHDVTNRWFLSVIVMCCKVFIGGLSYSTTDGITRSGQCHFVESLGAYCRRFGRVKEAIVMKSTNGESRGFGFCVFMENDAYQAALRNRNHVIDSRRVCFCLPCHNRSTCAVRYQRMKHLLPTQVRVRILSQLVGDGATLYNANKVFVGGLHYQTTQSGKNEGTVMRPLRATTAEFVVVCQ